VADGRTHDAITLWFLPLIVGGVWSYTGGADLALVTGGSFLFSGLMFSGDLDIHSNQYRRWGWLRWVWLPYRRWFAHRSLWSHGFIVGTVVRLLYVAGWVGLVVGLVWGGLQIWRLPMPIYDFSPWWPRIMSHGPWVLLGLELGAMSHTLGDTLWSGGKRLIKKFRSPKSPLDSPRSSSHNQKSTRV